MSAAPPRPFDDIRQEARERLEDAVPFLNKQANELRKTIIQQLREADKNIREQVQQKKLDAEAQEQVDKVLSRLGDMTTFLEQHSVEQMEEKASAAARQHIWRNLFIAFVVGLVIGLFLGRRD
ncbi:MAG: hypothetical protein MUE40_18930 [Anaerolineae bacterium]|nr:hypothetical protein [Anaerolineae bacterium]